ncbi:hypothetical protein NL676_010370 [Syzygium grande]|nr:hypothetical protein NL676_010370 [Syzygium grande]
MKGSPRLAGLLVWETKVAERKSDGGHVATSVGEGNCLSATQDPTIPRVVCASGRPLGRHGPKLGLGRDLGLLIRAGPTECDGPDPRSGSDRR